MMKMFNLHLAGPTLCLLVASACLGQVAPPPLPVQGQQQGSGRGQGMGAGMGMGGFMGMTPAMGTVTAISGSEITIKNELNEAYKVATSANTHFRKDRDEAKFSDIHVGDFVIAVGNLDESSKTVGAVFVSVLDPQQAARMQQMRASFGKTWTAGKITAINTDALTITIERPDKVTQTITVDENTTFRKGMRNNAEEITFPDIKVGDRVRANGALQNGNFAAKDLSVMEPGAGRGRFGQNAQPGQGQSGPGESGQNPPGQAPIRPAPQPEGTPSGTTPAQPNNAPQR